ncbi:Glycosyl transferases group 1 [Butyrivibrio fibrisolvens]|uniref:Glycosyl transferases group 1 n=1 Tax=Butyrivibrio fibrisolvens TaxID=831 RepID=A0A1H9TT46_BUTFI|nr:DUF3880 domain-containing protein [Butyrivibrio fibrisolvens]SES00500.1 Glycosyl transferases group 1 [Butyrivibrio fibrisolvens]
MRILYYDWDEFNGEDCRDAMRRLGYHVDELQGRSPNGGLKNICESEIREWLVKKDDDGKSFYDCVFSFDYFADLSNICQKYSIVYVSWVFDCPHYSLYSQSVNNTVNRIHIFDRGLYKELIEAGVKTVFHTPLGVNTKRLEELFGYNLSDNSIDEYQRVDNYIHDVTFLGNLYDNEFNFYDKASISQDLKCYLEEVFEAQQKIYGRDIISDKRVIDDYTMKCLRQSLQFEETGKFNIDYDKVILDVLRKKITVIERRKMLEQLGKRFDTVVYTTPDAKSIPGVINLGLADYNIQMPQIFRKSKININMTLRCISSGVPLRVMDILAAGGFLITTYQEEIAEYFEDEKDLVIVNSPEEMLEKTDYYLKNDTDRIKIAISGQHKVFNNYSYSKIIPEIMKINRI